MERILNYMFVGPTDHFKNGMYKKIKQKCKTKLLNLFSTSLWKYLSNNFVKNCYLLVDYNLKLTVTYFDKIIILIYLAIARQYSYYNLNIK